MFKLENCCCTIQINNDSLRQCVGKPYERGLIFVRWIRYRGWHSKPLRVHLNATRLEFAQTPTCCHLHKKILLNLEKSKKIDRHHNCILVITYIHNWSLQAFSQYYNLTFHTTYVVILCQSGRTYRLSSSSNNKFLRNFS